MSSREMEHKYQSSSSDDGPFSELRIPCDRNSKKRKRERERVIIEAARSISDFGHAKSRFLWSESLHTSFVSCIFDIGLKLASPRVLMGMMPSTPGLTSEHVKSHLQKFRIHRDKESNEFMKRHISAFSRKHSVKEISDIQPVRLSGTGVDIIRSYAQLGNKKQFRANIGSTASERLETTCGVIAQHMDLLSESISIQCTFQSKLSELIRCQLELQERNKSNPSIPSIPSLNCIPDEMSSTLLQPKHRKFSISAASKFSGGEQHSSNVKCDTRLRQSCVPGSCALIGNSKHISHKLPSSNNANQCSAVFLSIQETKQDPESRESFDVQTQKLHAEMDAQMHMHRQMCMVQMNQPILTNKSYQLFKQQPETISYPYLPVNTLSDVEILPDNHESLSNTLKPHDGSIALDHLSPSLGDSDDFSWLACNTQDLKSKPSDVYATPQSSCDPGTSCDFPDYSFEDDEKSGANLFQFLTES